MASNKATTLESLIKQEQDKADYRKRYNELPKVKERRALYNKYRQEQAKVARKVMKGDLTLEAGNAELKKLEKQYNDNLAKLNGQPAASRAQKSTNNGS